MWNYRIQRWIQFESIEDSNSNTNHEKNKNRFDSENLQNFTILGKKIQLFRCEMTEENEELNSELNSSRLTIQIQLNPGEKKE